MDRLDFIHKEFKRRRKKADLPLIKGNITKMRNNLEEIDHLFDEGYKIFTYKTGKGNFEIICFKSGSGRKRSGEDVIIFKFDDSLFNGFTPIVKTIIANRWNRIAKASDRLFDTIFLNVKEQEN